MTLDDAVLNALEQGSGNAKDITGRLVEQVRKALNGLAADRRIAKWGASGRGIEKTYSLNPAIQGKLERRI
jgi:hypothetical protein